jgi:hypothetical protein
MGNSHTDDGSDSGVSRAAAAKSAAAAVAAATACVKASVPEVFAVEITVRSTMGDVTAALATLAGVADSSRLVVWEE